MEKQVKRLLARNFVSLVSFVSFVSFVSLVSDTSSVILQDMQTRRVWDLDSALTHRL